MQASLDKGSHTTSLLPTYLLAILGHYVTWFGWFVCLLLLKGFIHCNISSKRARNICLTCSLLPVKYIYGGICIYLLNWWINRINQWMNEWMNQQMWGKAGGVWKWKISLECGFWYIETELFLKYTGRLLSNQLEMRVHILAQEPWWVEELHGLKPQSGNDCQRENMKWVQKEPWADATFKVR